MLDVVVDVVVIYLLEVLDGTGISYLDHREVCAPAKE